MGKGWLQTWNTARKPENRLGQAKSPTTSNVQDLHGNASIQASLGLGPQTPEAPEPAWWRDDPDGSRSEEGFLDHIVGLGIGVGEGVAGLVTGLKDLAFGAWNITGGWLTDPEQARESTDTLVSTATAILDDPLIVLEAILDPIKKDWEAGRQGEAIGRAIFEVAGVIVGAKGLDKVAKAARLKRLTTLGKVDDLGGVSKLDELTDASRLDEAADLGKFDDFDSVTIHEGRQGKHVEGHNNYTTGRSRLTADPEELLKQKGTGEQVGSLTPPVPGSKERIDFGRIIGEYVDPKTSRATPTTNGIIHYSKDGAHIVPSRP